MVISKLQRHAAQRLLAQLTSNIRSFFNTETEEQERSKQEDRKIRQVKNLDSCPSQRQAHQREKKDTSSDNTILAQSQPARQHQRSDHPKQAGQQRVSQSSSELLSLDEIR